MDEVIVDDDLVLFFTKELHATGESESSSDENRNEDC